MVFTNFSESMNRLMNGSPGDPEHAFLAQSVETPSIEPTANGYVGFCTNSRQQFADFLLMIERPDLQEDEVLAQFAGLHWSQVVNYLQNAELTDRQLMLSQMGVDVIIDGLGRSRQFDVGVQGTPLFFGTFEMCWHYLNVK